MQAFDRALFQQGGADPSSILLKHLDPSTRQEAQHDIAVYETKLKHDREQKKQKTAHARTANLPTELNPEQGHRKANHHCATGSIVTLNSCNPRHIARLTQLERGKATTDKH